MGTSYCEQVNFALRFTERLRLIVAADNHPGEIFFYVGASSAEQRHVFFCIFYFFSMFLSHMGKLPSHISPHFCCQNWPLIVNRMCRLSFYQFLTQVLIE